MPHAAATFSVHNILGKAPSGERRAGARRWPAACSPGASLSRRVIVRGRWRRPRGRGRCAWPPGAAPLRPTPIRPPPCRRRRRRRRPADPRLEDLYDVSKDPKPLGKGAFGVVKLCTRRLDGRTFAVKSIAKTKLACKEDVQDVRCEVAIMNLVAGHNNVVSLVVRGRGSAWRAAAAAASALGWRASLSPRPARRPVSRLPRWPVHPPHAAHLLPALLPHPRSPPTRTGTLCTS
jgi:hypothetical protein